MRSDAEGNLIIVVIGCRRFPQQPSPVRESGTPNHDDLTELAVKRVSDADNVLGTVVIIRQLGTRLI